MLHKFATGILFGLLLNSSALAELYKKVDEQGNITYSDVPSGAAKPVQPPGLTTYGTPSQHKQPAKKPTDATKPLAIMNYTALAITSPANDDVLHENSGTVTLKINVTPPLDANAGHKLIVLLDQKSAAEAQSADVTLKEVDRGAHALKVQITDAAGRVMKESAEINFQLHRGPTAATRKARK